MRGSERTEGASGQQHPRGHAGSHLVYPQPIAAGSGHGGPGIRRCVLDSAGAHGLQACRYRLFRIASVWAITSKRWLPRVDHAPDPTLLTRNLQVFDAVGWRVRPVARAGRIAALGTRREVLSCGRNGADPLKVRPQHGRSLRPVQPNARIPGAVAAPGRPRHTASGSAHCRWQRW